MTKKAIVFAYHNVGVRCIKVLLARGVHIPFVVTHQDNPAETIWFESVVELCHQHDIPVVTPNSTEILEESFHRKIQAIRTDFIFSFYYRHMLPTSLLKLAACGAYNLHGSLLPKYRGRVPVNWAVLHGETETGTTLHEMTAKPDAGAIIAQTNIPILPDDTAYEVFGKLTVAAEQTLWNALPKLLSGNAPRLENNLALGSYFGGRKPEDGLIDWSKTAQTVYNLHRAVAPPYPGAFTQIADKTFVIVKARLAPPSIVNAQNLPLGLAIVDNQLFGVCGDGRALHILELTEGGKPISVTELQKYINIK